MFAQDVLHWRSSRRSKKTCKIETLNPKNLKIESSSCHIEWTQRGNSEKCTSNSEQAKNYAKRFSRGHWSFLGPGSEKKWHGTHTYTPEGKWDSIATKMVGHFTETGHPVFKGISALSRGILKRKEIPYTSMRIHRTQNSCFAQFTQQISSVSTEQSQASWCEEFAQRTPNQKESISEKLVAKENEQLLKNVKPQEVTSLVQTPRSDNRASGNRLRECLQRFETLEKDIQFTEACEDASFWRSVSIGVSYKTILT